MKLKFVFCLVVLFSFTQMFAQQFYLKAAGGYGIGTASEVLTSYNYSDINMVSGSAEAYSFGEGLEANISAGYNLNSNISVEMEFGYHKSSAVNSNDIYTYEDQYENVKYEYTASSFNIIPSIVLHTEIYSIKPYVKFGPVLAFAGVNRTLDEIYQVQQNNYNIHMKYEYSGGLTFGINSAIGVAYNVGSNISISFEVNNKSMSYSPEEGEITEATQNGVTVLEQFSDSAKKFSYKDKLNANESQNSGDQLKTEYPFSSLSFLFGVAIEL
jgi:hypothetical protein